MPAGIGEKLVRLHPDPKAFWFGQFVKFIMRNNSNIENLIKDVKKKLQLSEPYVG